MLFSGDKLLGGPQAGIIAGRADLVQGIERDPLMRAVRLDKMTLAALEATLRLYLDPEQAKEAVPVLRMLATPIGDLRRRGHALADRLRSISGLHCEVRDESSYAGGGSLPDQSLLTAVVAVQSSHVSEEELAHRLRTGAPAVVARVQAGHLLFDLRTVFPEQEDDLIAAVKEAVGKN